MHFFFFFLLISNILTSSPWLNWYSRRIDVSLYLELGQIFFFLFSINCYWRQQFSLTHTQRPQANAPLPW
jgi:hypothetical protein